LLIFAFVTQIGWISLEIGFGHLEGIAEALFYVLNFSVFGLLMTLSLRAVHTRTGTLEISDLRGLSSKIPVSALAFIIGGLSMSGVPALGGWIDEFYFIRSTIGTGRIELTAIGVVVSILTLAYVLRTFNQVFLGELPEKYRTLRGTSAIETTLMIILIIITILIGVTPQYFMSPITKLVNLAFS